MMRRSERTSLIRMGKNGRNSLEVCAKHTCWARKNSCYVCILTGSEQAVTDYAIVAFVS